MFIEQFSLTTRVILLGTLGMTAWLIAFSRLIIFAGDDWNKSDWIIITLGVLNGLFMIINTAGQLRTMLRDNMKWFVNNFDTICWFSLIASYSSVLYIQRLMQPDTLDLFLLSFMLVIHSIHTIRFSLPISIIVLIIPAILYGLQAGGELGFYITLFVANQKLVLWGLGLGVLRELLQADKFKIANAQLKVAQARLAEHSRLEERRKIRQDLHDKMGHELAAMNMSLQLLEYRINQKTNHDQNSNDHAIKQTKEACHRLFDTLETVVGELRRHQGLHWYDQLMLILERLPNLKVTVITQSDFAIRDDLIVDHLICCIQEGLTNIIKHSNATHAWIEIKRESPYLSVSIRNNSDSYNGHKKGNGLSGIVKRMASFGGFAESSFLQEGSFTLSLYIPDECLV